MIQPGHDLPALLGEHAFVALAEAFGGTRLYVPSAIAPDHAIAQAIGVQAAQRLSDRLAPDVIKVPLARELRVRHYLAAKLTNARIARKLGIGERSVEKIVARLTARGEAPAAARAPDPLPLFPDS